MPASSEPLPAVRPPHGQPIAEDSRHLLSKAEREVLLTACSLEGAATVAGYIGVGKEAILRAVAGLPSRSSTIRVIRWALKRAPEISRRQVGAP